MKYSIVRDIILKYKKVKNCLLYVLKVLFKFYKFNISK